MKKVLLLVEGQTEETFVNQVLNSYFQQRNLWLHPVLLKTRQDPGSPAHRGGHVPYSKIKRQVQKLLGDSSVACVTTMLDYFGLPSDFPGKDSLPSGPASTRVAHLEQQFKQDINDRRFIPYIMLHDFEALVLVDPNEIPEVLPDATPSSLQALRRAIGGRAPEAINDKNPPAHLIAAHFSGYQKRLHSPRIVQRIGLDRLRQACPHFNQWITHLEQLDP
jgi:hypothetical protein